MQIPENPSNDDIREALIQLREELGQKVDRLEYKFDAYQKGTDGMVRMATTIIIATASVVVLSSLSPAVTAIITALYSGNAH
ncbi:MAG: hypothetical protein ACKPGT_30030 [Microcystis sp.]|jgi:hypothetical protein|uniref:Uncharacterized protein n=9 Tax=Microcystis TaxID=1125 RepID=A0A552HED4_MICVR|nr:MULTISPECIES: hypothetical protein [Microcystis]MBE5229895.1 hypothetical protein [Microcystis aeruginosa PMC 728.11]MCA2541531.1 hypothetical protein [Microcystis sp. M54BS1]MCA2597059.1 hypothetical protein [Microcystis sp. M38BS1]MCA2613155.1 hypothetical protein [Microcystis sp. M27BS1]MCZ8191951.1 hypothetical protein [Microcystis sp. LE19-338.1B]MCZ8357193.1 hypothetical protein [Microcystis sp. LE19-388.1G]MDY7047954.1 hypothetical protein [Microcystis panniformis WG22]NCQ89958.1 